MVSTQLGYCNLLCTTVADIEQSQSLNLATTVHLSFQLANGPLRILQWVTHLLTEQMEF